MTANIEKIRAELSGLGIHDVNTIYYNPSYETLYEHEIDPSLEGFDIGQQTELGAVNVMTGVFTGRSPKDKYIVLDDKSKDTVWWSNQAKSSDNKPIDQDTWNHFYKIGAEQLSGKKLYVVDGYAGANEGTRLKVRFVMEVAWQAHFIKNMFIRPSDEELKDFTPDFTILNAAKATNSDWKSMKQSDGTALNSEVFVAFNLTQGIAVIGGSL